MSRPHFEIEKRKDGKWGFRLKAANSEIIAHSQGYASKDGAEKGIEAVKKAVTTIVSRNIETEEITTVEGKP